MLPLQGVTVVSLEQAVAAPFATRQLADLGARVIKVERPQGDFARGYDTAVKGMSSHFVWLNRNKESVVLDLKSADGRRIMGRLLDRADVFVQNLAPGAAARLGFGAERLRERAPRLIVCDLSGYGSSGPYRDKKAYDLLIQCETGLVSITGGESEPAKAGISAADIAGGMYAFSGVLTALYERERTGRGTAFEVSLFDALGEWMGFPYYYAAYGGRAPRRAGARHAAIAPYGPFTAGDGSRVFLGVQNEREWATFCDRVLGRPELAADPRFDSNPKRVDNLAELREAIEGDGLTLHYQPITDGRGEILSAEALVRWHHPVHGLLSPGTFLPVAEQSDLLPDLDRWVLRTALREAAHWPDTGPAPVPVGVNLSNHSAGNPEFLLQVRDELAAAGLAANRLTLEITETSLVDLSGETVQAVEELIGLGVAFAVDDFGSGYSSLARLKTLPPATIKLDRQFVGGIEHHEFDRAIVRSSVDMAHATGRMCVVEGVETEVQFHMLDVLGVDAFQGFLFSRPVPGDQLHAVLAERSPMPFRS